MGIEDETRFFAAANGKDGFYGFYEKVFADCEKRFIIKGGPGTGKSRFLRDVGEIAEKNRHKVEYYYCSSDRHSLDAVIIDGKIAIADGTAPHTLEADFPGCRDNLIDFGTFWDTSVLSEYKEKILRLNKHKMLCFKRGYNCLSAAGKLTDALDCLVSPAFLAEKAEAAAYRIVRSIPDENRYTEKTVVTNSIGIHGRFRFDTLIKQAKNVIGITEHFGTAHIFLSEIRKQAINKNLSVTVSRAPLFPERYDAILLNSTGTLFTTGYTGEKNVNMMRFLDALLLKTQKKDIRQTCSGIEKAEELAINAFASAGVYHYELESIYQNAMDFKAKEEYTENFTEELFGL